jgi:hypothetical protein
MVDVARVYCTYRRVGDVRSLLPLLFAIVFSPGKAALSVDYTIPIPLPGYDATFLWCLPSRVAARLRFALFLLRDMHGFCRGRFVAPCVRIPRLCALLVTLFPAPCFTLKLSLRLRLLWCTVVVSSCRYYNLIILRYSGDLLYVILHIFSLFFSPGDGGCSPPRCLFAILEGVVPNYSPFPCLPIPLLPSH